MMIDAKILSEMSNVVRADALRAIKQANSGHVGIVLDAANIISMIYAVVLNPQCDRFVLSAGHGSAMLYATLKLAGYKVGDLDSFRSLDGLPGHPEFGIDGVAATTGPLGQGAANAVGMAIAAKHNNTGGKVYCLVSDGDLMEGVAQEAIAFAGRYKLDNLVFIWDNNGISMDGTALTDVNVAMRMRAAGWTVRVSDVDDIDTMYDAITEPCGAPLFIQCNTVLGAGSSLAGSPRAHGFDLSKDEITRLIEQFDSAYGRGMWRAVARAHKSLVKKRYAAVPRISVPAVSHFLSTREMSGAYLERLMTKGAHVMLGSADVGHSTNVYGNSVREITPDDFSGNYINYGVREHAMAAIMNGMAYCGMRAVGSAFLAFSDYMRGAMRLSALSGLPVVYVLSHDSIAVGPDGPTHQPVEQISGLRLIPNMNVFRPANMTEVAWAWRMALTETNRPSCIVLSRQKIANINTIAEGDIDNGAYVIYRTRARRVRMTIIATGTEVPLAISVARNLGIGVQVVSMPSVSHFRASGAAYQSEMLRGRVVAIEAGATPTWFEFADDVIGLDCFGTSGPGDVVYREYGFDVDAIVAAIRAKIKNVRL